ncbi:ADP-ribosylglycohydrolase family protein [Candidatus Neomarinimicrobiota bacterium]
MNRLAEARYKQYSKEGAAMYSINPTKQMCGQLLLAAATILILWYPLSLNAQTAGTQVEERRISVAEYRDKMMAGWIGQMVGVGWGAPTEFQHQGQIIPAEKVPEWLPKMVNVFGQDDLYVEMTFLRSMEVHGFDVSLNQAGIDFANSAYLLWHANKAGRDNLRRGIAPPNSGHPAYSEHADDIDYQIEADFSGLIAPGLPNTVIALGEKFGRLMNYGDGLYGGQFVGGMYAEAFFEDDPAKLVAAGLKCVPEGSQYAEAIRDVINWHAENPDNWEATWELINTKYHENPDYRRHSCSGTEGKFNIDAKLNGAYIAMGLLYGNGDPDLTTIISMRCGQDSDCNPSNAAGVLFTTMGFDNLQDRFVSGLDENTKFSFTEYNFPALIDICEKLAVEAVQRAGGRIEVDAAGEEILVIPVVAPVPSALEQSWAPGPVSDNTFSKAELAQIKGRQVFRYSLFFLIILVFLVLKENRNLQAAFVLIPLLVVFIVLELLESQMSADLLGTVNVITVFESLSAGLAILLLVGQRFTPAKWYVSIGAAIIVLAIIGFAGATGTDGGRYIAATKITIGTFGMQAVVWLLAMIFTSLLCRTKYSRIRFNSLVLLGFFIFHVIVMYLVSIVMAKTPLGGLADNVAFLLIVALIQGVALYLITLPYLILAYRSAVYEKRMRDWLRLAN